MKKSELKKVCLEYSRIYDSMECQKFEAVLANFYDADAERLDDYIAFLYQMFPGALFFVFESDTANGGATVEIVDYLIPFLLRFCFESKVNWRFFEVRVTQRQADSEIMAFADGMIKEAKKDLGVDLRDAIWSEFTSSRQRQYKLKELVKDIPEGGAPELIDRGDLVGKEILPPYEEKGTKEVEGKTDFTLLPVCALKEIASVRLYGDTKYKPDNWKYVPNGKKEFTKAAYRHLLQFVEGETMDQDSGLHHMAHVAANCMFILWLHFKGEE